MTAMMFGYGGMGGGWPVWAVALTWIGVLAFLGVLIWIGYALMTNSTRGSHQERRGGHGAHERRSGADARGVLDERLACGEIDAAEYQRLRGLIAAGDDQAPAGAASGR
jgi:uncharacterized membrane protein